MDIDAALNAIGGSGAQLPPPPVASAAETARPSAAQAASAGSMPMLTSSFKDSLLGVLDVLLRMASVSGTGTPVAEQFSAFNPGLTSDPMSVQQALQAVNVVMPQKWGTVASQLSAQQRMDIHKRFLMFGQSLLDDVREMGQAVSALRVVMLRVLPALSELPEDAEVGTSAVLADNYRVFSAVADIMQPEARQAVAAAQSRADTLAEQANTLATRMRKAGLDPAIPAKDSQPSTTNVVLGVVLGLVFIGLIIAAYFAIRKQKGAIVAETQALGGRSARAPASSNFGGVAASAAAHSGVSAARQPYLKFPAMSQWGSS